MNPENLGNGNGVNSEGDVVPIDDYDVVREAGVASRRLVVELDTAPARQVTKAERAYDQLQDAVERARGQGLDAEGTRYNLDPNREIEKAYKAEKLARENAEQDAINQKGTAPIHDDLLVLGLGKSVDKVTDPGRFDRTPIEVLAREAARVANKGKRA